LKNCYYLLNDILQIYILGELEGGGGDFANMFRYGGKIMNFWLMCIIGSGGGKKCYVLFNCILLMIIQMGSISYHCISGADNGEVFRITGRIAGGTSFPGLLCVK